MISLIVAIALAQPTQGTKASRFISTSKLSGSVTDGNFSCPNNPASTTPCLVNPSNAIEIAGACYAGNCASSAASIWFAQIGTKTAGPVIKAINAYGGAETRLFQVDYNGDVVAGASNGDFYTGPGGHFYCSNANTCYIYGGAGGSNPTLLIVPAVTQTSGNVITVYANPVGSPIFTVDVNGAPQSASTTARGTCTLNGGTPSSCTATVRSGAVCTCSGSGTTAAAAIGCATSVTSTTLTVTAANGLTSNVAYVCL